MQQARDYAPRPVPISAQDGFTLVELAIVLMVIGLLIGAILRGEQMIRMAQLKATIKQIDSYVGAIALFEDAYGLKPGDMPTATARLANCTNVKGCYNGNGNGIVGDPTLEWILGNQGIGNNNEDTQFWRHLALTHMITGINTVATTQGWGQSHPIAPIAGGFSVITSQDAGLASFPTGTLVLRMHGGLDATAANIEKAPSVSPFEASYLDRKMDDGQPLSGGVRSKADGNGGVVAACEAKYDETRNDYFCVMSFVIE